MEQKNFGSGKKIGVKKNLKKKKFKAKINCGSKKFWSEKKVKEKFGSKIWGLKKLLVWDNFGYEGNLSSKFFSGPIKSLV